MDGEKPEKPKKKYVYARKTQWFEGKKYEGWGKTEAEAIRKLADKIAAAKRGEGVTGGNMTADAYFELWLKTYKASKDLTPKSLSMYGEKYRNYIQPVIGSLRLRDVKEIHLQSILNGQAGKSASHVKKIRMVLQAMFKRARQSRLIVYDPAELLELPSVTEGHRRPLTEDERASVLETAKRHPRGLWVLTLLYTGMRPSESAALRWRDVDFERREIRIRSARESGSLTIKAPKTESGVREIPIRSELLPLLQAVKETALQAYLSATESASASGNPGTSSARGASGTRGTRPALGMRNASGTRSASRMRGASAQAGPRGASASWPGASAKSGTRGASAAWPGASAKSGTRGTSAQSGPGPRGASANGDSGGFLDSYVFPGPHGKPADDSAITRWWKSFCRAMDIERGAVVYRNQVIETTLSPDLTLYCLRHTFATDLQRAGVQLTVAKDLMGHADISMTAHYTHKDNALLHEAIARLSAMSERGKID